MLDEEYMSLTEDSVEYYEPLKFVDGGEPPINAANLNRTQAALELLLGNKTEGKSGKLHDVINKLNAEVERATAAESQLNNKIDQLPESDVTKTYLETNYYNKNTVDSQTAKKEHTHNISDIIGIDTPDLSTYVTQSQLTNSLNEKANTQHKHDASDIIGYDPTVPTPPSDYVSKDELNAAIQGAGDQLEETANSLQQAISGVDSRTSESIRELQSTATDLSDDLEESSRKFEELQNSLVPLTSWKPEGSDSPIGVAGFVKSANDNAATLGTLATWKDKEFGNAVSVMITEAGKGYATVENLAKVNEYASSIKVIADSNSAAIKLITGDVDGDVSGLLTKVTKTEATLALLSNHVIGECTTIQTWEDSEIHDPAELYYKSDDETYAYYVVNGDSDEGEWKHTKTFSEITTLNTLTVYYVANLRGYWYHTTEWEWTENASEAGLDRALAGVRSIADDNKAQLDAMVEYDKDGKSALAGLTTYVDQNSASISALAKYSNEDSGNTGIAGLIADVNDNTSTLSTVVNHEFTKNDGTAVVGLAGLNTYVKENESKISLVSNRVAGRYTIVPELVSENKRDPAKIYATYDNKNKETTYWYYTDIDSDPWESTTDWAAVSSKVEDTIYYVSATKQYLYYDEETEEWNTTEDAYTAGLPSAIAGIQVVTDANSSSINNLTSWSQDKEGKQYSLAEIKQTADNAGGSIKQVVTSVGEDGQVTAASIVAAVNKSETSVTIDADHIKFDGFVSFANKSDVDEVKENAVYTTRVEYALSSSADNFEPVEGKDGVWSTKAPEWRADAYMWQQIVAVTGNGDEIPSRPACIQGAKGENGTGVAIKGTAYVNGAVSDDSIGDEYELYSDENHSTKITNANDGDAYLVKGYLFVYSGSEDKFTCAGKIQGPVGPSGRGVQQVVNYYMASSRERGVVAGKDGESTELGEEWTTDTQNSFAITTATKPYLWNYEVTMYTDGFDDSTDPTIIGRYTKDGNGISSIVEFYCISANTSCGTPTSETLNKAQNYDPDEGEATADKWYTTLPPTTLTNKYLWNCERIIYTERDPEIFAPALIGVHGSPTVQNVTKEYYLSSSDKNPESGEWKSTPTGEGSYLWTRYKFTMTEGADVYSDPTLDPTYTNIADWCYNNDRTLINGAKIATGTIDAQKIKTNDLSSISANLGTVTAGVIQSKNKNFKIDLDNNTITATNFNIDADGNATYSGTVSANNITAGTIDATQVTINNLVVGENVEMGDATITWNKIDSKPDNLATTNDVNQAKNDTVSAIAQMGYQTEGQVKTVISESSISTDQIEVTDLRAFDATIGGWEIDQNQISKGSTAIISDDSLIYDSVIDGAPASPIRFATGGSVEQETKEVTLDLTPVVGTAGYTFTETFVDAPRNIVSWESTTLGDVYDVAVALDSSQNKFKIYSRNESGLVYGDPDLVDGKPAVVVRISYMYTSFDPSLAKFKVLDDGSLYASAAEIEGRITTISGNIGGWMIDNNGLTKSTVLLGSNIKKASLVSEGVPSNVSFASGYDKNVTRYTNKIYGATDAYGEMEDYIYDAGATILFAEVVNFQCQDEFLSEQDFEIHVYTQNNTKIGVSIRGLANQSFEFIIRYVTPTMTFSVLDDGSLYASAAQIEGKITATSGEVGGWTVDSNTIHCGSTMLTSEDTYKDVSSVISDTFSPERIRIGSCLRTFRKQLDDLLYFDGGHLASPFRYNTFKQIKSVELVELEFQDGTRVELDLNDDRNLQVSIENETTIVISGEWGGDPPSSSAQVYLEYVAYDPVFKVLDDGSVNASAGNLGGVNIGSESLSVPQSWLIGTSGLYLDDKSAILDMDNLRIDARSEFPKIAAKLSSLKFGGTGSSQQSYVINLTCTYIGFDRTAQAHKFSLKLSSNSGLKYAAPVRILWEQFYQDGSSKSLREEMVASVYFDANTTSCTTDIFVRQNAFRIKKMSGSGYHDTWLVKDFSSSKTITGFYTLTQYTNPAPSIEVHGALRPDVSGTFSLGDMNYKWHTVYATTSSINTSDRNEKEDIVDLANVYETLFDNLKPSSYRFKVNDSNRTHIGFVGQDVKDSITRAGLTTTDFAGYCEWTTADGDIQCGLRYDEFIALNTWQTQKLKQREAELETRVAQLEAKLNTLYNLLGNT